VPMVNTHPALLPSFPGTHGPADALAYGDHRRDRPPRRLLA
jgi:folate-dependent phosphoribosylglycinamide formyltransferase PurN